MLALELSFSWKAKFPGLHLKLSIRSLHHQLNLWYDSQICVLQSMYCDDMNIDSTQIKGQENGSCLVDTSSTMDYSHMQNKKKKSPLRLGKKIYEFYNAPIVKFWFYTVSLEFGT